MDFKLGGMFLNDRIRWCVLVVGWIIGGLTIIMQSIIEPIAMNNIIVVLKDGGNGITNIFLLIVIYFISVIFAFIMNLIVNILKRMIVFAQNANDVHGLMTRVLCAENEDIKKHAPEQMVTRLSRDVLDYAEFKVSATIESPLVVLGLIVTCFMMFVGSPDFLSKMGIMQQHGNIVLGSVIIIMTPLHLTFLLFNKRLMAIDYAQAEAYEKEIQISTESLRAIEDVRALNAFDFVLKRIGVRLEETRKTKTKLFAVFAAFQHLGGIVWVFTQVIVLGVSAWLISKNNSDFKFEDYMGFSLLCGMYNQYLNRITEVVLSWQRAKPAKRRILYFANLHARFSAAYRSAAIDKSGALVFDKMWYKVGNHEILCDINLKIRIGDYIAIVGPSGSGKSTLLKLAMCHLSPTSGGVYYGGQNIDKINYQMYTSKVSYVSQKPFIFEGTILDNILVDRKLKMSFEDIVALIEDVVLVSDLIKRVLDDDATSFIYDYNITKITWRNFICSKLECENIDDEQLIIKIKNSNFFHLVLKAGLLSRVGSEGSDISGGQVAKIALARALAGEPEILLLDEITASLDELSQEKIINMLLTKHSDKGIVFVTHCLGVIQGMDNIYVLNRGRIIQSGSYDNLIHTPGLFSEMISSNLGKKKL